MSEPQNKPPWWAMATVIPVILVIVVFIVIFLGILAVKAMEWALAL